MHFLVKTVWNKNMVESLKPFELNRLQVRVLFKRQSPHKTRYLLNFVHCTVKLVIIMMFFNHYCRRIIEKVSKYQSFESNLEIIL